MRKKIFSSFMVSILFLLTLLVVACGSKGYRSIKVFSVDGSVNVIRNKKTIDAEENMKLKNNDTVSVLEMSSAVLKLDNDKFVMVKENTTLKLVATGKKNNTKTRIIVEEGGVVVEVKEKLKEKETFEIASSNSVMAIRGTQISFSVEVKDNKITTSVAVLEGSTQILLFKDEKLSATTLNKDFRLSYTTDLNDVAEDITKVIKKSKIEEIDDTILEEVFNVVKEELTSEEIDDIVDTINTFEREEDDQVNGVIKFKFKNNPKEGEDPKDSIEIEEAYRDLFGLKYTYSSTIDGEYKEFDTNNPLSVGEWYCKITAGNAYRSDPLKFNVYENGPVDLKLTFASDAGFMIDPKDLITTDKEVSGNIKYVYSSSRNGEFKEFDPEKPLGLGTWYCKVLETENYKSDIFEFEVVKRDLEIKFDYESVYIGNNVFLRATISDLDVFFNSPLASIIDDNPGDYPSSKYKYYLSFWYGQPDDNEFYPYLEIFDYENRSSLCNSVGYSYDLDIYFDLDNSCFPEEINIVGAGVDDYDYFVHPDHIDYSYAFVEKSSEDTVSNVYVALNWFCSNSESKVMARLYTSDSSQPMELEASSEGDEMYSVTCPGNYDVEFYLSDLDTEVKTEKIHVDYSNFADASATNISSGTPSNALVTFNGNMKNKENDSKINNMNFYYDINFDGNSEFSYLSIFSYQDTYLNISKLTIATGTTKYVVVEDTYETSYSIKYLGVMKEVDGLAYVSNNVEVPSGGINEHDGVTYGYMGVDGDSNRYLQSYAYFEKGNGYVLDVFDDSWNKFDTITDEDYDTNNTFYKVLEGYNKTTAKVSGMAYGFVSQDIVGEYTNELGLLTDDAFTYLKTQLANDGITVKGINMHVIDCVDFQLG